MTTKINFLTRKSTKEGVWKTLNLIVGVTMVFNMSMVGALVQPSLAKAQEIAPSDAVASTAPVVETDVLLGVTVGAIWTTNETCADPAAQDDNQYVIGETVHIRGSNFLANTDYFWRIVGQPGGASSDPSITVASGSTHTDGSGYFCKSAYTILSDDGGTYTVDVYDNANYTGSSKNDNYRVNGVCDLRVTKTVDKTTAIPGDKLTYTISYDNKGGASCTGTGVKVYDTLTDMDYFSATASANADTDPGFTGKSGHTLLANLHEVSPGETGSITLKTTVTAKTQCGWTVKNTGSTDGNEAGSDKNFSSPETTVSNDLYCPHGKISGYKKDAQENKLNGWEICLKKHSEGWDKKTCVTTGSGSWATGYYEFTGLSHADYDLRETMQTNWHAVTPSSGQYLDFHVNNDSSLTKNFVNAPDVGYLKVYKDTDPYNGSATFSITASGTYPVSSPTRTIKDGSPVTFAVTPGTYSVAEDLPLPAGWYLEDNTCVNKVVTKDNTTSCTITNHKPITIKATKIVCDSESDLPNWGAGGSDITSTTVTNWLKDHANCRLTTGWDFQYHIAPASNPGDNTGASANWTTFGPTDVNGEATASLTNYSGTPSIWAREVMKPGYIDFSHGANPAVQGPNGSAEFYCHNDVLNYDNYDEIKNASAGNTYYCVGFNVLATADLTVIKHVINDNGGQATAAQWDIHVKRGSADVAGSPQAGLENGTIYTLPLDTYTVSETGGVSGYAQSIVCDGQATDSITLTSSRPKTCTITNDDIAPSLTLVKNVDNTVGGVATKGSWWLSATSAPVASLKTMTPVGLGGWGGAISDNTFQAGAYTLAETGYVPGYAAGTWNCQGGSLVGNQVTLGIGESATCEITNTFAPLTILKEVNKATALPSDVLTYTVTVTNPGDLDVYNAKVTDVVPSYLTPVLPITDATNYDVPTKTITWEGFTVPAHGSKVFTFQVTVDSVMPFGQTPIDNTATLGCRIRAEVIGLTFGNIQDVPEICWSGSSVVRTTVDASPTILIVKSGAATVTAGTNLVYTLNWSVNGNSQVTNAIITDPLPTNTTFVSADNGGVNNAGVVTWNLGTKAPGATGTVSFTVKVNSPLLNGTVLTNIATFDTTETLPKTSTVLTTVQSAPSLSITKTNNLTTFTNPGQQVTYTVTVTNATAATDTARNVVLTDILPSGFTYADNGLATRTFSLGDIAPGASVVKTYLVNIATSAIATNYVNTATAKGDNTGTVTATSTVEVRVPQVLGVSSLPNLTLTKTVKPTTTNPGKIVTYTITVVNKGDADATNVTIVDTLPKGFTFLDDGSQQKILSLGTLKAEHSRVINLDVRVGQSVKAGKYDNTAVLSADGLEQLKAQATVTVKVPEVLGLATTGPSVRDLAIFLFGTSLLGFGLFLTLKRQHGFSQA